MLSKFYAKVQIRQHIIVLSPSLATDLSSNIIYITSIHGGKVFYLSSVCTIATFASEYAFK